MLSKAAAQPRPDGIGKLVQNYLREERHTQLMAETERFRAQHSERLPQVQDEYLIAVVYDLGRRPYR